MMKVSTERCGRWISAAANKNKKKEGASYLLYVLSSRQDAETIGER